MLVWCLIKLVSECSNQHNRAHCWQAQKKQPSVAHMDGFTTSEEEDKSDTAGEHAMRYSEQTLLGGVSQSKFRGIYPLAMDIVAMKR